MVTPIDYRHLLALGRSRWGPEVEDIDLYATMGRGSVMKISSQDTFEFMRGQNYDLQVTQKETFCYKLMKPGFNEYQW